MKYKGLIISDIHIGVIPMEELYLQFQSSFIEYINNMDELHYIIIDGDYFDHKLFLNDIASKYASKMLQDIIDACKKFDNQVKIRFVYGTESHECNQYDALSVLINSYDIEVIKYAKEEELLPGMKVLYLPEEHILDKKEYYKEFFEEDQKYDYIFGHGIIREAMKEAAVQNDTSSDKRKKVPVFSTAEFRRICKGQTYFGHYHVNTDMDDVFYVGSFTRWQFGEDQDKGFYETCFNTKKETYINKFIKNELAKMYKTISFGYKDKIFDDVDTLHQELDRVDHLIKTDAFDHVRFEVNIPETQENPEFVIDYLKERYKFNKNIKVNIVNGYIEAKKKQQKEKIKEDNDKYDFIFEKDISLQDKTSHFISIEYNRDISPDHIENYLTKPLNDILIEEDDEIKKEVED